MREYDDDDDAGFEDDMQSADVGNDVGDGEASEGGNQADGVVYDDILSAYDDRHGSAAVKIQSRVRGRQVRARAHGGGAGGGSYKGMNAGKVDAEYDYADRHGAAAVKIQSRFRGGQARTRVRGGGAGMEAAREELAHAREELSFAIEKMEYEYDVRHGEAAVKIQSRFRGGQVRARGRVGGGIGGGGSSNDDGGEGGRAGEHISFSEVDHDYDARSNAAAVKIQSRVRGTQVRTQGRAPRVDERQRVALHVAGAGLNRNPTDATDAALALSLRELETREHAAGVCVCVCVHICCAEHLQALLRAFSHARFLLPLHAHVSHTSLNTP